MDCSSLGLAGAPVMFLAFSVRPEEKTPFTHEATKGLPEMLTLMKVPKEAVYMTNLHRTRTTPEGIKWVDFAFAEIKARAPKAVILLGMDVAKAMLPGLKDDLQHNRCARYRWPKRVEKSTFFITHDAANIRTDFGLTDKGMELAQDIEAVLKTDQEYYPVIRIVGGFAPIEEEGNAKSA